LFYIFAPLITWQPFSKQWLLKIAHTLAMLGVCDACIAPFPWEGGKTEKYGDYYGTKP
jgi:hypothetical protein